MTQHIDEVHDFHEIIAQLTMEDEQLRLRRARSPLHILVVDDDPVTQALVKNLLGGQYRVEVCTDPRQATNEYLRLMPDLVFLDIELGDKDYNGFDVLHTLKLLDREASIVMLSGHDKPENIACATREGAFGFLAKPFQGSRLKHYAKECEWSKSRRQ